MMRRLFTHGLAIAAAVAGMNVAPAPARATLVYEATLHGGLRQTGNAVGLSKALSANGPGTAGSIGTFITTDTGSVDLYPPNPANPWFGGTTASWQQQRSAAFLALPPGAVVTHAQLLWGGSYLYFEDVTADLDDAVALSHGAETPLSVSPDPQLSTTLALFSQHGYAVNYYVRSADVTSYVAARGGGQYAVGGIPATQSDASNSLNAGGWALIVAYATAAEPLRNLQIRVGGDYLEEGLAADVSFSGFVTPEDAVVAATLLVAAMEGDADLTGDQLLLRGGAGAWTPLSAPGNFPDNFFASQINDESGILDTSGTFGHLNHAPRLPSSGARQGWDLTGVPLSSAAGHLAGGQQAVELRAVSAGDQYVLCAAALAIEVVDPASGVDSALRAAPLRVSCRPNPFNPRTTISYDLPEAGPVRLCVYDLAGRLLRTLVDEIRAQGSHDAVWDGRDASGRDVGSGTYLARLEFGGQVESVRMGLVR